MASLNGQSQIHLSWTDNAGDETEFSVERSANGTSDWVEIARPTANATSYSESGLACGVTRYYRMRAYRSGNGVYSPYSNISSTTTAECDTTSPTVSSIVRANADPTSAASVDFTVTFSESVFGVDVNDFALTTTVTGASITTVTPVIGSDTIYTVSVSTGSGSGTIRLDVTDDDSILDSASLPLGGAGVGNGNFTAGESYTIPVSWVSTGAMSQAPVGHSATLLPNGKRADGGGAAVGS